MAIGNTAGTTGYALAYLQALNQGRNNDEASKAATVAMGGSGLTQADISKTSAGSSAPQYNSYDPSTGYAVNPWTINSYTAQAKQTKAPEAPSYNLAYPQWTPMDRGQAMNQAGQQIDPLTELSRMNMQKSYQTQRDRLPQYLNARGQLYGGLRVGGENTITQEEAQAMDEMNLRSMAEKSRLADLIRNREDSRAKEQADSWYRSEQDKANMGMRQWEQEMSNYNQDRQSKLNLGLVLENMRTQQEAARMAADQDTFNRGITEAGLTGTYRGQPTFQSTQADKQWNTSPQSQDWFLPLTKQSMEADVKNTLRSASAPYSTGGGGASKPTQTERQNNSLASAYESVDNAFASGVSYDQIVNSIQSQTANLTRQGIDPQKVIKYAESKAPAQQEEGWYTNLDKKLGGILPFGSPW